MDTAREANFDHRNVLFYSLIGNKHFSLNQNYKIKNTYKMFLFF